MKIVLITGHYYGSKRQAGFHFLARSLSTLGAAVTVITVPISLLSLAAKDFRILEKGFVKNLLFSRTIEGVHSMINASFFHPIKRRYRWLDHQIGFWLNRRCFASIESADVIIFESNHSLYFFGDIKRLNPTAKLVYRMSDDMSKLNFPDSLLALEKTLINRFDRISVPTAVMAEDFKSRFPKAFITLDYHGIEKDRFDSLLPSPYTEKINHIFVGNSHLDFKFLSLASSAFPDHHFHIIGPFSTPTPPKNVHFYGQMPFSKTIPFIQHASAGLAIRRGDNDITKTLSDSLKILQYTYCKLPVIAPELMRSTRPNWFTYEYDNPDSIQNAIQAALQFDRTTTDLSGIHDWSTLAKKLVSADH